MTLRRWHFGEPPGALRDTLRRGGILAIPTESSYGLGVDPRNANGVQAVFEVKRRDGGKPLPVVVAGVEQLPALGVDPADPAVAPFVPLWPAPLSVLAPLRAPLPAAAGANRLAVRVPDHAALRRLLVELGPLTATSANRSGEPPVLDPLALEPMLAGVDAVVVDGGVLPGGPPSTLVEWTADGPRVRRAGRYPLAALRQAISAAAAENPVEK